MKPDWAEENLQTIRTLMERSAVYRRALAPIMLFAGAVGAAAAIIGMNNIYYRFLSLVSNENYSAMPAKLRMNIMRTHGVDPRDFELWSLAVSAIHGCGKCINAHERLLREKGLVEETILAVVRIAAVVSAIGGVLVAHQEPVASFN